MLCGWMDTHNSPDPMLFEFCDKDAVLHYEITNRLTGVKEHGMHACMVHAGEFFGCFAGHRHPTCGRGIMCEESGIQNLRVLRATS